MEGNEVFLSCQSVFVDRVSYCARTSYSLSRILFESLVSIRFIKSEVVPAETAVAEKGSKTALRRYALQNRAYKERLSYLCS